MVGKTRREGDNHQKDATVATLTIRDVVLIMAAVVSVVAAWGVYGTRLSLLESNNVSIQKELDDEKALHQREVAEIKAELRKYKEKDEQEHKEMREKLNKFGAEQARRKSIVDKVEREQLNK